MRRMGTLFQPTRELNMTNALEELRVVQKELTSFEKIVEDLRTKKWKLVKELKESGHDFKDEDDKPITKDQEVSVGERGKMKLVFYWDECEIEPKEEWTKYNPKPDWLDEKHLEEDPILTEDPDPKTQEKVDWCYETYEGETWKECCEECVFQLETEGDSLQFMFDESNWERELTKILMESQTGNREDAPEEVYAYYNFLHEMHLPHLNNYAELSTHEERINKMEERGREGSTLWEYLELINSKVVQ